jgi:hypothetical protein
MRSSRQRGERELKGTFAGALFRLFRLPAMLLAALITILAPPGVAQDSGPTVSPDRVDDILIIPADSDPFPQLDNFAWRAFIALNWPSLTDADHRGMPDRAKAFGDPGPRVWETYKSRYELFQAGSDGAPVAPPRWATYDALNPCGARVDGRAKTLASFTPFMDFNQPIFIHGVSGSPLVAQNGTYTRYETRLNETEYSALSSSGWSQSLNLPDRDHPAQVPAGSIAVKAAWRILTEADTPAIRSRYYVVKGANVVDAAKTIAAGHVVCSKADIALVGLHIVIRTKRRPQGLWSTFEHVDNVPPVGVGTARGPDARDAHVPYSYFDPTKPQLGLWPSLGSSETLPASLANPPEIAPTPMQVVRRYPIHPSTMEINRTYWSLPGIKGTIWEHYMLVANQWPSLTYPVGPENDGVYFPDSRRENMVTTTMETYFQDPPSNCMSCHHRVSNALGRDFVGILGSFR